MNKIVFAGEISGGERKSKEHELFFPEIEGEIKSGDSGTQFKKGEIVVIPPRCAYLITAKGILLSLQQALLPHKEICVLSDDEDGGARFAAFQAVRYFSANGSPVLAALGDLIAAYVAGFSKKSPYSPIVEGIISEIERGISDVTFSLDDCLKRLPLNYDYVRKLFKKETGLTPHAYLMGKRMELAAEFLTSGISNRYSDYSISQVAESCGFSEPLYFSRVFKKYYSVSPSDYKARN